MTSPRHNLPSGHGSTLLELMLYIGIISLLMVAVVGFSVDFLATSLKADAAAEAAWNARFALGRLTAEIRQANGYDAAHSTFGASTSVLSLCSATTAACAYPGTEIVFTVSGGRLTVSVNGAPALPLTAPNIVVDNFTVTDLSTDASATVRSRNFGLVIHAYYNATGLWITPPDVTYQTTERLRRSEGFAN